MIDFAVVEITNLCNLKCSHCYLGDTSKKNHIDIIDVDLIIKNLLDVNCKHLTISGGEPFVAPEVLSKFIYQAKQKGLEIFVVSNGTCLNSINVNILKMIDHIQLSLDGPQEVHDNIRGYGVFNRLMQGINYLKSVLPHDRISIQMTISPENQYSFIDTYNIIKNLGLKMSVERVSNVGNAEKYKNIDFDNYSNILNTIVKDGLLSSDPFVNVRKLQLLGINPSEIPFSTGCSAGKNGLTITSGLDVLPCVRIRKSCGNLLNTQLYDIVKNSNFTKYTDNCSRCQGCQYINVCGGCKADFLAEKNSSNFDKLCAMFS